MPLVLRNFSCGDSVSGIWKITENETELFELCNLNEYDLKLLNGSSSVSRRIEILAVRALVNQLNLNLVIRYDDRKPVCDTGHISISHSNSFASVIWHPEKNTAIDIEEIDKRLYRIAQRAFSDSELIFANNDLKILTLLWNCKECVFKLCNDPGIEFRTQIRVLPFDTDNKIICEFYLNDEIKQFELYSLEIDNNTLVWGVI
ncbi:MAG: 4'-phosphopantetheinyl transferase superfamily protein [Bacteroidales bacterium]|jgi:4'-phosphopantetheinyl transferase EntD|nr:4'-phosphopantetheinyl transferase superfamily protein [Bacteroidales bacterium]